MRSSARAAPVPHVDRSPLDHNFFQGQTTGIVSRHTVLSYRIGVYDLLRDAFVLSSSLYKGEHQFFSPVINESQSG